MTRGRRRRRPRLLDFTSAQDHASTMPLACLHPPFFHFKIVASFSARPGKKITPNGFEDLLWVVLRPPPTPTTAGCPHRYRHVPEPPRSVAARRSPRPLREQAFTLGPLRANWRISEPRWGPRYAFGFQLACPFAWNYLVVERLEMERLRADLDFGTKTTWSRPCIYDLKIGRS